MGQEDGHMIRYWKAALYSTKAGVHKKVFAWCAHRHQSTILANNCARRLNKVNHDKRRWWQVAEIVLRPWRVSVKEEKV